MDERRTKETHNCHNYSQDVARCISAPADSGLRARRRWRWDEEMLCYYYFHVLFLTNNHHASTPPLLATYLNNKKNLIFLFHFVELLTFSLSHSFIQLWLSAAYNDWDSDKNFPTIHTLAVLNWISSSQSSSNIIFHLIVVVSVLLSQSSRIYMSNVIISFWK